MIGPKYLESFSKQCRKYVRIVVLYRNLFISCRISDTSSSVMENSSAFFCSAVMYRLMIHFITSLYRFAAISRLVESFFILIRWLLDLVPLQHRHILFHKNFGVGMMLKGGGTVDPVSK